MEKSVESLFNNELLQNILTYFKLDSKVKKLGDFENYVFEVYRGEQPYILRITHSTHRKQFELEAELDWIRFLAENGLSISIGIPLENGKLVAAFEVEDSFFYASLFTKANGRTIKVNEEEFNENLIYQWGKITGKMHKVTKKYVIPKDLSRPHWYEDDLLEIERYIPNNEEKIIENGKNILAAIRKLPLDKNSYGLIHSDIHPGNFFWDGDNIHVFDFDDCNYHWFISDIAIPLYYCVLYKDFIHPNERMEFSNKFIHSFLKGYLEENLLSIEWVQRIPLFLKLRDLLLYVVLNKKIAPEDRNERINKMMKGIRERIVDDLPIVEESIFFSIKKRNLW